MSIMSRLNKVSSRKLAGQRGVGLVEVLIALLVLSIGLLGLAALQTQALKFNQGAFLRTQATTLAYDILDRMRANREQASSTTSYITTAGTGIPAMPTNCEISDCSPGDMAKYDLNQWKTALRDRLPAGDGTISVSGSIYTIETEWEGRDGGATVKLQIRSEI